MVDGNFRRGQGWLAGGGQGERGGHRVEHNWGIGSNDWAQIGLKGGRGGGAGGGRGYRGGGMSGGGDRGERTAGAGYRGVEMRGGLTGQSFRQGMQAGLVQAMLPESW